MPTFIVLLGPPGVGKGTQAKILAETAGLPHISSGDLFRENMKNETELGKVAQTYINKGELVPDDVTIGMIRERLTRTDCRNGAVLDGFPRTIVQAETTQKLRRPLHKSTRTEGLREATGTYPLLLRRIPVLKATPARSWCGCSR